MTGEAKWNKVSNGHGLINFGLDMLQRILKGPYCFNAIVVHKEKFRNWSTNREKAFYQTYTELIKHCVVNTREQLEVHMDNRSDSYSKRHEVVNIIVNHMLHQVPSQGVVSNVTKSDSKQHPGLQVADILTGAINSAHHRYLNPALQMSDGKKVFISRMARILGWDEVIYDTWPNVDFNIWHFPKEYRANPMTRRVVPNFNVPFVRPDELTN